MIYVLKLAAITTVASALGLSADHVASQNTIKLWYIHPDGYPVTEALKSFADDVRRVTGGRGVIEVVSDGALGYQPQAIQMMKSRKLDMRSSILPRCRKPCPA